MKYQLVAWWPELAGGNVTYYKTLEDALVARAIKVLEGYADTRVYKFVNAHVGYVQIEGE